MEVSRPLCLLCITRAKKQGKWFPWFGYNEDAAGFVCMGTFSTTVLAGAYLGSRLCFKSPDRAAQFGKQFADLYNMVFL